MNAPSEADGIHVIVVEMDPHEALLRMVEEVAGRSEPTWSRRAAIAVRGRGVCDDHPGSATIEH